MWDKNLVSERPLERCPMRTLLLAPREQMRELEMYRTQVYPLWKRGMFLRPGSAGDQPAREIALMLEFDASAERVNAKYEELIRGQDGGPEANQ
jgi:hypothetical protein